jgi:hypothetical protein
MFRCISFSAATTGKPVFTEKGDASIFLKQYEGCYAKEGKCVGAELPAPRVRQAFGVGVTTPPNSPRTQTPTRVVTLTPNSYDPELLLLW